MDGYSKRPNQWNPETPEDDVAFDSYMRRLALVSDEEYEAKINSDIPVPEVPPLPPEADFDQRLKQLSIALDAFIYEHHNRTRKINPFKNHTPKDARAYVAKYPRGFLVEK